MSPLRRLVTWLRGLLDSEPVRLAIVRRYADANGSFVGELYLYSRIVRKHEAGTFAEFVMVGASLDTLPFDAQSETDVFGLDTRSDFLEPMPPMTVRVGAHEPRDNEAVREMVRALPRRRMTLIIQNRFIERVLGKDNEPKEKL
jgi:hypothetical protein